MKSYALITGATSGLGLAYAKEYASQGYSLILTGRREAVIEKNAREIEQEYHVSITIVLVDLSNQEGLNILLNEIKGKNIEVLINNAGYGLKPSFSNLTDEEIDKMHFLHTMTVMKLIHEVLPHMQEKNIGTIINISSLSAFAVMPHNVLYASTKTFLVTLTQGLAMELKETKIQIQVICPGFVDSDFHEMARMKVNKQKKGLMKFYKPEEIVTCSMKNLKNGKIVVKPTFDVKIIDFLTRLLPRMLAMRFILKFSNNYKKQREKIKE